MNSQERILTAYDRGIPDKVPVVPRLDSKWLHNAGPEIADYILKSSVSQAATLPIQHQQPRLIPLTAGVLCDQVSGQVVVKQR